MNIHYKIKRNLSVFVGSVFLLVPLYQVVLYGFLISDKIDYKFIITSLAISLVFFWGRLKVLAKNIQEVFTKKLKI